MKYPFAVIALAAAAISVSACSHSSSPADMPPGTYHDKTSSTDSNNTTTNRDTTTTVGYDANGRKRAVITNKKTVDPEGLFNESTTQSDQVIEK